MATQTFQFPKPRPRGSVEQQAAAMAQNLRALEVWLNSFLTVTDDLSHDTLPDVSIDDHHNKSHIHDGVDGSGTVAHSATTGKGTDDHHAQAHTVASHSDTTGTGAELNTLTDGSVADTLHTHAAAGVGIDLSDLDDVTITAIAANEVLKWNGTAWINQTLAEASISAVGHTHVEANITDLQAYILDITGDNLSALADATITAIAAGELLKWSGTAWINQTLAEAGISGTAHTHAHAATTGKTANDHHNEAHTVASHSDTTATGAELNTLTDGSDGDALHGHTEALSTASDVTITAIAAGEILKWSGTAWINNTLAEAGVSATGHSHVEADVTDLQAYILDITGEALSTLSDVTIVTIADGELLRWDGVKWINNTLAEAGIAAVGAAPSAHTIASHSDTSGTGAELNTLTDGSDADALHVHSLALSTASDVTITAIAAGEILKWSGTAWINNTLAEAGVSATGHAHTESDISDLQAYLLDITGEALSTLSDATITAIAAGELLKWNGSAWINNTLAEAGVSATGHAHVEADISDLGSYLPLGGGTMSGNILMGQSTLQDVGGLDFGGAAADRMEMVGTATVFSFNAIEHGVATREVWRIHLANQVGDPGDMTWNSPEDEIELLRWDQGLDHWATKRAFRFENSFGDIGGQIFAFDTTTRDIIIIHAGTADTLDAVRFQLHGNGDSSAGDALLVNSAAEDVFRYDFSDDRFEFEKDVDLASGVSIMTTHFDGASKGVLGYHGSSLELGRMDGTNLTPFIDFHGGDDVDRNARIILLGDQSGNLGGELNIEGAALTVDMDGDTRRSIAGNAGCVVDRSSALAIGAATWTFITWNREINDDLAWHSTSVNAERITVDTAGWYMVTATVRCTAVASGERLSLRIGRNATVANMASGLVIARNDWDVGHTEHSFNATGIYKMAANDHFEVAIWGTNAFSVLGSVECRFAVARLF